jgi:hypothetical protein
MLSQSLLTYERAEERERIVEITKPGSPGKRPGGETGG